MCSFNIKPHLSLKLFSSCDTCLRTRQHIFCKHNWKTKAHSVSSNLTLQYFVFIFSGQTQHSIPSSKGLLWIGPCVSTWRRYFVRVAPCPPYATGLVLDDPSVWDVFVGVCVMYGSWGIGRVSLFNRMMVFNKGKGWVTVMPPCSLVAWRWRCVDVMFLIIWWCLIRVKDGLPWCRRVVW